MSNNRDAKTVHNIFVTKESAKSAYTNTTASSFQQYKSEKNCR
jgi:hypothetical protein